MGAFLGNKLFVGMGAFQGTKGRVWLPFRVTRVGVGSMGAFQGTRDVHISV